MYFKATLKTINECMLMFIRKLEPQDSMTWAANFMEQLLVDANLEGNLQKRLVLLDSVYETMFIVGKGISIQSKQLLEVVQNALLAPPQPVYVGTC